MCKLFILAAAPPAQAAASEALTGADEPERALVTRPDHFESQAGDAGLRLQPPT